MNYYIRKNNWEEWEWTNMTLNNKPITAFSLWNWKLKYYREWGWQYTATLEDREVYINGKLKTNF